MPTQFQLTAARRRLHPQHGGAAHQRRFNSQPLEGGCAYRNTTSFTIAKFQLTAARRRLHLHAANALHELKVSTHSRSKAAASAKT